jgi:hypothetical protein
MYQNSGHVVDAIIEDGLAVDAHPAMCRQALCSD